MSVYEAGSHLEPYVNNQHAGLTLSNLKHTRAVTEAADMQATNIAKGNTTDKPTEKYFSTNTLQNRNQFPLQSRKFKTGPKINQNKL